ncbi:MAG: hypothetical protein K2N61_12435, partial [Lachnospiraceae bacterium]|nr:hypothetical protein [Lachnospiraceae bacterium]
DSFIDSFEKIIEMIREKDQPEEIFVNVSSGTPAMKSSLQILSMLWNDVYAIQVSTPCKSSNKNHEDKDSYDLNTQWQKNKDREASFENRCIISGSKNLLDRMKKENIQKYIEVYDYEAARMMVQTLSKKPSDEFTECLKIAIERTNLNIKYVNQKRKKYKLENWFPIDDTVNMKEYEYLLVMQMKLYKKQYADFIRDVTPIFFSFAKRILEIECNLKIENICNKKNGIWRISVDKLKTQNIKPESFWNKEPAVSAYIILKIIEQKSSNKKIISYMEDIRLVEEKVRNFAAHEIIDVTDEKIQNETGFTSNAIMQKIFKLAEISGLHISSSDRKAYNVMNKRLVDLLKQ